MDGWPAVPFAPLFSGVLPDDFRRISALARVQRFVRRQVLYLEGDAAPPRRGKREPVEQVFLLMSGLVKSTKLSPRGAEVILRVGVPGDVLGAMSLCSTGRHATTAQALRVGYALVWEARVFQFWVESLPVIRQNMIRLTCENLEELQKRFRELATERVAPRLARQLLRLQEQIGQHVNDSVEIGLSREGLAQMTGTTLFTVSRLLGVWEARGLVNPRYDSVAVWDLESLRKLSDES